MSEFISEEEYVTYDGFADVYDEFMDNIPYDEWCIYIEKLLKEHGIDKGIVLDMACGTGTITDKLAKCGYDMIGMDISQNMLRIAGEKCRKNILWLNQDMREMELYGTVAAVICICDGMNYLVSEDDFLKVLKKVNNYLDKEAIFIFDLKTIHFYRDVIGNRTIADNRDDASFIWENEFNEKTGINEYILTTYKQDEEDVFIRSDELHRQRGYEIEKVKSLVKESGMKLLNVFRALSEDEASESDERIYFVLQETYQQDKIYK